MNENINKLTKDQLIQAVENLRAALSVGIDLQEKYQQEIEVLNDHIGSLQEKIELMHIDLANQIHWRLKLEEEINGKKI